MDIRIKQPITIAIGCDECLHAEVCKIKSQFSSSDVVDKSITADGTISVVAICKYKLVCNKKSTEYNGTENIMLLKEASTPEDLYNSKDIFEFDYYNALYGDLSVSLRKKDLNNSGNGFLKGEHNEKSIDTNKGMEDFTKGFTPEELHNIKDAFDINAFLSSYNVGYNSLALREAMDKRAEAMLERKYSKDENCIE